LAVEHLCAAALVFIMEFYLELLEGYVDFTLNFKSEVSEVKPTERKQLADRIYKIGNLICVNLETPDD
jgi:hypothetical protein